ncbi:MAG: DUF1015 domain-containing protein [Flavobacteriales bacterium]|nr:DUF1015 domain-containing protein [Flavobacteriales bacterium]
MAHTEFIPQVAVRSSDFSNNEELLVEMRNNPHSYLHLTKNDLLSDEYAHFSQEFFKNSKAYISHLIENEIISRFEQDIFFVYRQTSNGTSHTGIIGLVDILDYQKNKIKKHEHTRHVTEGFVMELLNHTKIIGDPLLLSHHHKQSLEDLLRWVISHPADIDYEKREKRHQIWYIESENLVETFRNEVETIQDFYIMDGHHRAAGVNNLYNQSESKKDRYCLAYLIDCNQLSISPFHRLVKQNKIMLPDLLEALSENFLVTEQPEYVFRPDGRGQMVLKTAEKTYMLTALNTLPNLDVQVIENDILNDIFGITNSRTDDRVDFIKDDEVSLNNALGCTKVDGNFLFLLHPCTFEEIADISDKNEIMPPKSTYVEPKCPAGLFLQKYGQ